MKKHLKPLEDIKQQCKFSWLCGLRALPLLSVQRGFAYWSEGNRQKHLYSIFNAMDVSAKAVIGNYFSGSDRFRAATNADVDAAFDAGRAANTAKAARVAAYAAANAADIAITGYNADVAAYAGRVASSAAAFDLKSILLKDIEAIKEKGLNDCNHDTSVYGKLWDDFQEDLKATGCAYWARFYENLFRNSFRIDEEQLKRHLGVPDEIRAEGAAAVGRYLEGLGDKTEWLNEARIIILGEKGAGKTSLARKLLDIYAEMPEDHESTEGVETHIWDFPDKDGSRNVNAYIWDFAGHSITHSAHRCFMSARCLYIYVYNGRIERDNDPAYWLEQIRIHGGNSPVLFLINEKDEHKADIAEKTLKNEYPSIAGYYRVDIGSKDKTKLEEFRQIVMDMVRNNPSWNSQIVSEEAYKIKSRLREYFDKTKSPHITREEFDAIAKEYGVQDDDRIEEILEDLHTLGICLWYKKEEMEDFNTLVLNPDWITNGIYRIINRGYKEHEHILTVQKSTAILKDNGRYEYPRDKVAYLFKLMKVYELAFFKNTDRIFIPGVLRIDSPDGLPTFDDANDHLTMSFNVEKILPPNITSRIIVQRSDEIFDENLLWRKGTVLKYRDGNAIALVIEDDRSVTVHIKGADKTAYIASMHETIEAIFKSYKVIKQNLRYKVLEEREISKLPNSLEEKKPLMVDAEAIIGCLRANRPYFDAPNGRDIPLEKTAQRNAVFTDDQFNQIVEILEKFLKSEQVGKNENARTLQTEIDEIKRRLEFEKSRERLCRILSNIANITTIGTALSMYLAKHPEIPQVIQIIINYWLIR
jgi:GTPase SAR1 family protein